MSKERELKCWLRLLDTGQLPSTQAPRSVQEGEAFAQLLGSGILAWRRKGSGRVVAVLDAEALAQYVAQHFPEHRSQAGGDGISNLRRYRNSKAAAKTAVQVVLLRGQGEVTLNGQTIDLGHYTTSYGCMAALAPRLRAPQVCTVENLDCFLRAEEVLGPGMVFLHPYGRLGPGSLPGLEAGVLWHFGDYDFTGLNDYLNLRARHPQAQLYLPDQLETYWQAYAQPLKAKAVPSKKVQDCTLPAVQRVLNLLATTQQFLEQQALFADPNSIPTAL